MPGQKRKQFSVEDRLSRDRALKKKRVETIADPILDIEIFNSIFQAESKMWNNLH